MNAEVLAVEVLNWWSEHCYDCNGEFNVYDEVPEFVQTSIETVEYPYNVQYMEFRKWETFKKQNGYEWI